MIPFNNLERTNNKIKEEIKAAINRVVDSNWFILGEENRQFEEAYADYMGAKHCIGVSNGLDALHLILEALDLPKGSEVIVPANTFIATALAVSYCGYKLRLVDVEPDSRLMDPKKLEAAITEKTRVIMPVHLFGNACDMDRIMSVADSHGLYVVEDNAQSQGCRYGDRYTGCFGIASGTSFYPGKNIGALGDAGAILTDDDAMAQKIRALANYGSSVKYRHDYSGFNNRLDEIQAAVLRVKLKYLREWNESRTEAAAYYMEHIDNPLVTLPTVRFCSVWHLFVLGIADGRRDAFIQYLKENGVETAIHYPIPVHMQRAYAREFTGERFPVAERLAQEIVSIPMNPYMRRDELEKVVNLVNAWC